MAPVVEDQRPARQNAHEALAGLTEKVPAGHALHALMDTAPSCGEYVPAAQAVQNAADGGDQ